jgi:MoaA/NifB/PqqE/SkfB family radical SAM enzyme
VRDYKNKPYCYPDMSYYIKNEMTTEVVINALKGFKIHNPNIFHLFYGGEPLLRPDLPDIINYCNEIMLKDLQVQLILSLMKLELMKIVLRKVLKD